MTTITLELSGLPPITARQAAIPFEEWGEVFHSELRDGSRAVIVMERSAGERARRHLIGCAWGFSLPLGIREFRS